MNAPKMPVLFIGHGSPMNAIADNRYTRMLANLGRRLPAPRAILVISAHWMTQGTWITHMAQPKTIHDFGGFPPELFAVQYPAPGSPQTAEMIQRLIQNPRIQADEKDWGLDHGTWSVLKHMYPKANIPVLQLSLSLRDPAAYHFQLGQQLASLRDQEILILGSGNVVHNLRQINWREDAPAFDWALEFDQWIKTRLEARDFEAIVRDATASPAGKLSVPTPEHFLPLLYILGAAAAEDSLQFEFAEMQNASISMRSLSFGLSEE